MSKSDNGRMHFATGIDNSSLRSDAAQAQNILRGISTTAVQEGKNIDDAFRKVGKTIAGAFTIQQASAFARQIVSVRSEVESLEKSFEILAGKASGKKLFGEIRDFAIHTPMQVGDLAKGAQTLMAFNIEAKEVMQILRSIGDISLGDAQKFNSLILAFSQMRSVGKLMGQELLQMINAGFNPLAVISEQTGKSIGTLKEEMSAGAISADMITKAFYDAAAAGGKFHGMLESQSKTTKGAISNLKGAVEEMLNSIGKNVDGIINGSIQAATDLVYNYEKVGKVIAELIATIGVYKAALITLNTLKGISASLTAGWTVAELAHFNALVIVEKAQKLLNATILKNPYVAAAAAVAALAYGIYKLVTAQTDAEKAQKKLNKATENFRKETASERVQIDSLFARLKAAKEGTEEYHTAKQSILNQYGEYLTGLGKEIQTLQDIEGAYKAIATAAIDAAKARALNTTIKEAADEYSGKETDAKGNIMTLLKGKFGDQKGADGINLAETYYWKIVPIVEGREKMTEEIQHIISQFEETVFTGGGMFGGGGSYQDNPLQNQIDAVQTARGIYDNSVQEANRLFGTNPQAGTVTQEDSKPTEVVKNKKYWEDYLKEQQGLLDAMTEAELKTEEAEKIRANIAQAQNQIELYNVARGNKASEQREKEENDIAVQTAERLQKIEEYGNAVSRAAKQAEFDIRQAEIDGMEEGLEKSLAQNELNYDKMIDANLRRKEEMLEALRDKKELEWENANPKAKEQGLIFNRSSVTEKDLTKEQLKILEEYERIAQEIRIKADKESLDTLLSDFITYEDKRAKITEEFARKRKSLYIDGDENKGLREGVKQGNVDELNKQEQDALTSVDEQFAQREASYQAWCDSIANITLEQLKQVLTQAEEELAKLEKTGGADSKQLAVARAKVANVRDKIDKKNAKNNLSPDKRSIEDWNELRKALEDCCNTFDEIGDAIGGVAGEIISTTGNIMSSTLSMINGIVQLVTMSATAMTGTSTAAAKAIQTVEKASVILAVISAAMQIAMQIINLFNSDKQKQEEIEALQGRIDELQWELDHVDIMNLRKNSIDSLKMVRDTTAEVTVALLRQRKAVGDTAGIWRLLYGGIIKDNDALTLAVNNLAQAYTNVKYTADKALGENKYKQAEEDLKKLTKQQIIIQEQIRAEEEKKKTDDGTIADMQKKIEELGAEAVSIINDIVEDIIGGSSTDIANELADAFFEAFEAGEDAAEAWGEKVNDIVGDILKRLMVQKFLEEPLGEVFDKYKSKWFKDGKFSGIDTVINSLTDFANDLKDKGNDFADIWGALPEEIKDIIGGTAADREASKEGIATASQESVDELNGRATAIQGHTYSINEQTKNLVSIASATLESVLNIEQYTERIADRVDRVERNVWDVKSSIDDISIKGIKIHQ